VVHPTSTCRFHLTTLLWNRCTSYRVIPLCGCRNQAEFYPSSALQLATVPIRRLLGYRSTRSPGLSTFPIFSLSNSNRYFVGQVFLLELRNPLNLGLITPRKLHTATTNFTQTRIIESSRITEIISNQDEDFLFQAFIYVMV
jgi:hypothetical protein